jgi:large subunit ribosomal protein L25
MQFEMKVETRQAVGKGIARALRRSGKIPGILYGQGECVALTMEPEQIRKVLHSASGSNSLLNLDIAGGRGKAKRTAMLRDHQVDPISGAILHADLFEVAMDKPVRVRVPVAVTEGTPVGVAEGGVLQHNLRDLHIECLPAQIPDHIMVDPGQLKINQGIHVKEIPVTPGIRILDDPEMMVVSIVAPISEAKLEALLSTTPAGEGAVEPEVIGKAKEEETAEEAAAGAKAGAKAAPAAGAEPKEEKKEGKEGKEGKEAKGEKKK